MAFKSAFMQSIVEQSSCRLTDIFVSGWFILHRQVEGRGMVVKIVPWLLPTILGKYEVHVCGESGREAGRRLERLTWGGGASLPAGWRRPCGSN